MANRSFPAGPKTLDDLTATDYHDVLARILEELGDWMAEQGITISSVGHRVVHGGPSFYEPVEVTPEVEADIESALAAPRSTVGVA